MLLLDDLDPMAVGILQAKRALAGEVFPEAMRRPSRTAMPIAAARARMPSNAAWSRATSVKCSIELLSIFSL